MTPEQTLYQQEYYRQHWAQKLEYAKTYRERNLEQVRKSDKAYRVKNEEAIRVAGKRYRTEHRDESVAYSRALSVEYRMLSNAKHRARDRGLPFDLTVADIQIPATCPVLDIPLIKGKGRPTANSPSLDRIDPTKGYIPGNVMVISYRANTIKQDATAEELERVTAYVAKWQKMRFQ